MNRRLPPRVEASISCDSQAECSAAKANDATGEGRGGVSQSKSHGVFYCCVWRSTQGGKHLQSTKLLTTKKSKFVESLDAAPTHANEMGDITRKRRARCMGTPRDDLDSISYRVSLNSPISTNETSETSWSCEMEACGCTLGTKSFASIWAYVPLATSSSLKLAT